MNIEWLLTELWANLENVKDINLKSNILVQLFTYCQIHKILISEQPRIKLEWDIVTFYPDSISLRLRLTAQLVNWTLNEIQERNIWLVKEKAA